MTDDLVKRLREVKDWWREPGRTAEQAADRIDALEKALVKYGWHKSTCDFFSGHDCSCGWDEARSALGEKKNDHDLVKRLREGCSCNFPYDECKAKSECYDAFAAANMIEKLQKSLRLIAEHPVDDSKQWEVGCKEMKRVAILALGEKKDGK